HPSLPVISLLSPHDALPISSTSYRCRSEPQIAVEVTSTIASVGSSMRGSGTSCTRTSRLPCQVAAFIADVLSPRTLDFSSRRLRSEEHTSELQSRENLV